MIILIKLDLDGRISRPSVKILPSRNSPVSDTVNEMPGRNSPVAENEC